MADLLSGLSSGAAGSGSGSGSGSVADILGGDASGANADGNSAKVVDVKRGLRFRRGARPVRRLNDDY